MEFIDIFGPGELDEDEGTYRREFPGVRAGGTRNVLSLKVLKEHSDRREIEYTPWPGGTSENIVLERDNMTVEVENYPSGLSTVEIDFDDRVDSPEGYMRSVVDQWLGEIIRREQKAYRAANHYVHSLLPRKADEEDLNASEILENQLEDVGNSLNDFHDFYRHSSPNDLAANYAAEFELWPHQDAGMKRSELPGRMPSADEIDDPDLRPRNDLYQRIYLESVIEEADDAFGVPDELREKWLEYADLTYS